MKPGSDENVQAISGAVRALLVSSLLAIGLAQSARANTIYTYTGKAFTYFSGSYSCINGLGECQITGSITLPQPIPPNQNNLVFGNPTSFDFTDGSNDFNITNTRSGSTLQIFADNQGNIDTWFIDLCDLSCTKTLSSTKSGDGAQIFLNGFPTTNFAGNNSKPGTWTITNTSAVPEPGSLLLLGTGLLGLGTMVLRRKQIA